MKDGAVLSMSIIVFLYFIGIVSFLIFDLNFSKNVTDREVKYSKVYSQFKPTIIGRNHPLVRIFHKFLVAIILVTLYDSPIA